MEHPDFHFGQPERDGLRFGLSETVALPLPEKTVSIVGVVGAFDFALNGAVKGLSFAGAVDFSFADDTPKEGLEVFAAGFDALSFGLHEARLLQAFVSPKGFDASVFGGHAVFNRNRFINPRGFDAPGLGKPTIRNASASVFVRGWDSLQMGGAAVSPFYIAPRGIDAAASGKPAVANARAVIAPVGFEAWAFGRARVELGTRYIEPAGFDAAVSGRGHWLSFGSRYLKPDGWDSAIVGAAELGGGVRSIAPVGIAPLVRYRWLEFEYTVADERDIPAYQTGYKLLSFGDFGQSEISNKNRVVRPAGFDGLDVGRHYAAGDVQRIETKGWDSSAFGGADYWSLETVPRGWRNPVMYWWQGDYWRSAWQNQDWVRGLAVFSARRPAFAAGFDTLELGRPLIAHNVRTIAPHGWDSFRISDWVSEPYRPNPILVSRTETVKPFGFDASTFGKASLRNTRLAVVPPVGFNSAEFGLSKVWHTAIAPRGLDASDFGLPEIGGGKFQGWDSAVFGYHRISLLVNEIKPAGFDAASVGVPSLKLSMIKPAGFGGAVFGDVAIANRNRVVSPASVGFTETVSPFARIWNKDNRSAVTGWDSLNIGLPEIQLMRRFVYPAGSDSAKHAVHDVDFLRRGLRVSLGDCSAFGKAGVSQTPKIYPIGLDSLKIGQPEIKTNRRSVFAGAADVSQFGRPGIDFVRRNVEPDGWNSAAFGTAWVSHDVRRVLSQGFDALSFGTARVSFGLRAVGPVGFDSMVFRQPEIGQGRRICPVGFDATEFGGRIIPDISRVEYRGFDASGFGTHWVFASVRKLAPFGFDASADGFGQHEAKLMRRYIIQIHDELGSLAPPEWTGYTSIGNVNRTIAPVGIAPPRVSEYALVHHAARVMKPVGFDALETGQYLVAFAIRNITPESWDSFVSTQWAIVRNDARVPGVAGFDALGIGLPEIRNNSREWRFVGAHRDFAEFGSPMVAFARRSLQVFGEIAPPPLGVPAVFNAVQYVGAKGWDSYSTGLADVMIRRNELSPKWHHKDYVGVPDIRNVTPELHAFGADMAEFGKPCVALLRRYVQPESFDAASVGSAVVGWRDKTLTLNGWDSLRVGLHKVWHLTTPDNYSRVIEVSGIAPPVEAVGSHHVRDNVVRPKGFDTLEMGRPDVWCGVINVEIGIGSDFVGVPDIRLNRSIIAPKSLGDFAAVGKPRLSPHTIWACPATQQAIDNHGGRVWHDVDAHLNPPKGVGVPTVRLVGGASVVKPFGFDALGFGTAVPDNALRYIKVSGWQSLRMGWQSVGDGRQWIEQFDAGDFAEMGSHRVAFAVSLDNSIKPRKFDSLNMGKPEIQLKNRVVAPRGWDSMAFVNVCHPLSYMPQHLAVYFPLPVIPKGWDSAMFGQPEIGLFTRYVAPVGFDAFASKYDIGNFKGRMRVTRGVKRAAVQTIRAKGWQDSAMGGMDVRSAVYFIRIILKKAAFFNAAFYRLSQSNT